MAYVYTGTLVLMILLDTRDKLVEHRWKLDNYESTKHDGDACSNFLQ